MSVAGGGGRRKSYNTGGNIFPKSARPKLREKIEDNNSNETEDKVTCEKIVPNDNWRNMRFTLLYRHLPCTMVC